MALPVALICHQPRLYLLPLAPLLLATVAHLLHSSYASYRAFLRMGPGAFPPTVTGWALAWLCRAVGLGRDREGDRKRWVEEVERQVEGEKREGGEGLVGWLREEDVPARKGEEPVLCEFPIPQRHPLQAPNSKLAEAQLAHLQSLASSHPTLLTLSQSRLEQHGPALFCAPSSPLSSAPSASAEDRFLTGGEIVHLHEGPYAFPHERAFLTAAGLPPAPSAESAKTPSSSSFTPGLAPQSLHLTLSPPDAALVLSRGWGVRHPMSGYHPPFWARWLFGAGEKRTRGKGIPLPEGYVMIYAPRDEEELKVVERAFEASCAWMAGMEVEQ
ncbi:hypothetical protein JCM6882_005492 [Rhodosporidiobolus microsporus]